MKKQSVLLVLLFTAASVSAASEFKEDDWNLSDDSVTRIESVSATCATNLDHLAKYGYRGSQTTTFKVMRPNYMNSQVLVDAEFFYLNLDKGQAGKKLSRKSISNIGAANALLGAGSRYIKKDVSTSLILQSESRKLLSDKTSATLTLRTMDKDSGVEISLPSGSMIARNNETSISISAKDATVMLIDVESEDMSNWSGSGFASSCRLTINFNKFPAKKVRHGEMSGTSYRISGTNELLPVR